MVNNHAKERVKTVIETYYPHTYRLDLIDLANLVGRKTYSPLGGEIDIERLEYQDWGRVNINFNDHCFETEHLPIDNLRDKDLFLYFLSFEMAMEQIFFNKLGGDKAALLNQIIRYPRMESCWELSPYHVLNFLPEAKRETLKQYGESLDRGIIKEYTTSAELFANHQAKELIKFGLIKGSKTADEYYKDPFNVARITADEVRFWLKDSTELLIGEILPNLVQAKNSYVNHH